MFGRVIAVLFLLAGTAWAAEPVRYVSLKSDEAFLREGPTFKHRVLWIYKHKGYPFVLVAKYDNWIRVRDVEGTEGWMNDTLLSNDRTVLVTGTNRISVRASEDAGAKTIAFAEPGAILHLKTCSPAACDVEAGDVEGWVDRDKIWGVGKNEVFEK